MLDGIRNYQVLVPLEIAICYNFMIPLVGIVTSEPVAPLIKCMTELGLIG
jgi:hypothetical protein